MPISCHFSPTRPGRVCVKTEIGTSLKQGYDRRVIFFLLSCHSWKFPEGTVKNRYDFSTETRNDWLILSYFQLSGEEGSQEFSYDVFSVKRMKQSFLHFGLPFIRDEFCHGQIVPQIVNCIQRYHKILVLKNIFFQTLFN